VRLNAGLEMGAASAVATYDSAERLVLIGRQLVARRHTAAAARRARALAVLRPFTFLELAPSVPPSPNADGAGHFLNFTTCFYYTTPNLELKKVKCATRHNFFKLLSEAAVGADRVLVGDSVHVHDSTVHNVGTGQPRPDDRMME